MSWGEALRLTTLLTRDPASQVTAAIGGWAFAVDRATLATLDLFDLTMAANTDTKRGRPKPHPGRPMAQDDKQRERVGKAASVAQVNAVLNRHGHNLPV